MTIMDLLRYDLKELHITALLGLEMVGENHIKS